MALSNRIRRRLRGVLSATAAAELADAIDAGLTDDVLTSRVDALELGEGVSISLGSFGSTPDAKGITLSESLLTLQPADATHPGALSLTTQSFKGAKTFIDDTAFTTGVLNSGVADGASAIGFTLNTTNTLANATAKIVSLKNNGTEKTYFLKDGALVNLGVASGSAAVAIPTGSRIDFSGGTAAGHISYNSGTTAFVFNKGITLSAGAFAGDTLQSATAATLTIKGSVADGSGVIGIKLNTTNTLAALTAKLLSIQNNSVEKAYFRTDGSLVSSGTLHADTVQNNSETFLTVMGFDHDGASAVAIKLTSAYTLSNATAKLISIQNNLIEKAHFKKDGALYVTGVSSGDVAVVIPAGAKINFNGGTGPSLYYNSGTGAIESTYWISVPGGQVSADYISANLNIGGSDVYASDLDFETPTLNGTSLFGASNLATVRYGVTIPAADWIADDVTQDIVLFTLPARARIVSFYTDTTEAYTGLDGTINLKVGVTTGGDEIILSHDVKSAPVVKGLLDADLGAPMTHAAQALTQGAYIPDWDGETEVSVRLTSSVGNIGDGVEATNLLTGSTTFYCVVQFL